MHRLEQIAQAGARWNVSMVFLAGAFVLFLAPGLNAQRKRDLVDDSPFLPPGYQQKIAAEKKKTAAPPKPPPRLQQNLELRGMVRLGGVWRFSIFDKRTSKGQWIALKARTDSGLTVLKFNDKENTVEVEEGGHTETLTMRDPSGTPVPIAHLKAARKSTPPKPKPTAKKPTPPKPNTPIPRRRIVTPRN